MQTRHRVPYVIVYVENLEASEKFYTEVLGLRVREFPVSAAMLGNARALSVQGTTIVLVQKAGGEKYFRAEPLQAEHRPAAGRCYPSFEVADLVQFHAGAVSGGVECLQSPETDQFGAMAIYRDPDGLLFTVVELAKAADKHGIVLSGGGSYGAFELGVLRELAGGPVPHVLTGTSVGAFNAAYLACGFGAGKGFAEVVEDLARVWTQRVAGGLHDNGVFRLRGDVLGWSGLGEAFADAKFFTQDTFRRLVYAASPPPLISRLLQMVDISTLFSVEPLRELIMDTISWQALEKSPCQLQVAATDWKDGRVRLFGHGSHPSDQEEPMTEWNVRNAVLASTAIPGIFQPVEVDCAAPAGRETRIFVDGGLVMNSPLNPAIDAGASVIHLICLNPDVSTLSFSPINSTLDVFERALVTAVAANVASDIDRARLVNRIAGVVRRRHSDEFYRPVTIHRYHPSKEVLGGLPGILDFSGEHLDALIRDGAKVAREHDCKRCACVIPE